MENKTVYSATLSASQEAQKKRCAAYRYFVLCIGFGCGRGHKFWNISTWAA